LFRQCQIEIGERDDAFVLEGGFRFRINDPEFSQPAEQQRARGQCRTILRKLYRAVDARERGGPRREAPRNYLMKSIEMVAGAPAVIVIDSFLSGNCGFLKTISRTPRRIATLASGVSPTFSPSM
jgi:hypothetical protein